MAVRTVPGYFYVNLDTATLPSQTGYTAWRNVTRSHKSLIREVGCEAMALLKNSDSDGLGLPLKKPASLPVWIPRRSSASRSVHATSIAFQSTTYSVAGPNFAWGVGGTGADIYEGHLASGGGSGQLALRYLITPYEAIQRRAIEEDTMFFWIMNNTYTSSSSTGNSFGIGGGTGVSPSYANYASQSEVCLVFINSWSGEGADCSELSNDEQDQLVTSVAESCDNTIVVINVSGPRVLDAWIENENVTAVLYSGLLGQESGNAIADVLYGNVNSSGKLIHTVAKNASDYPASVCTDSECLFDEGVYLDYHWFDANNIEARYPFGQGLSYTSFSYGGPALNITNRL